MSDFTTQSTIETFNLDFETTIKNRQGSILEKFTQSNIRREQVIRFGMNQDDCENKYCASTQVP